MGLERHYTDSGLPAFVLVSKPVSGALGETQSVVYPKAPEFDKLWAEAEVVLAVVLDKVDEVD